ncbi:MAG TPA: prepilin-type N-terminal cleavage/methylation domain-containing protein [Alcanivoracaceae bacterium]|nr:prepilin-type N-terminal cleavage/methylation domain-containing protein [Alcanivoracaceae bacterium]
MYARGLTLLELLVALAVLSLLLMISVPSYQRFITNRELANATEQVMHTLHHARLLALAHGGAYLCDGEEGCDTFTRTSSLGIHLVAQDEAELEPHYWVPLPRRIQLQWRRFRGEHLFFNQQGRTVFSNGHFLICHHLRNDTAYKVILNWSGRARIERSNAEHC